MNRLPTVASAKWLADKLSMTTSSKPFRILDGSWYLSSMGRNERREFLEDHIPGAQFFDIEECSDKSAPFKRTVPTSSQFEHYVSQLGICNNTHVVVYDNHPQYGFFSAPRVWWTFRIFGHPFVTVLNGGLKEWKNHGFETTDKIDMISPSAFKAKPLNSKLIKSFEQMEANVRQSCSDFAIMDARSASRFRGGSAEPRPGADSGHMPGAANIPYDSIFDRETGLLKSREQLCQIFESQDIDLTKPLTATCGSGMSACMIALAAHECGKDDVSIYDGSWVEWSARAKPELKVSSV